MMIMLPTYGGGVVWVNPAYVQAIWQVSGDEEGEKVYRVSLLDGVFVLALDSIEMKLLKRGTAKGHP